MEDTNLQPVDFEEPSFLVGKLCAVESLPHLRYRVEEYDRANKTLLLYGPIFPYNSDEEGEIEPDRFSVSRHEALVEMEELPLLPAGL